MMTINLEKEMIRENAKSLARSEAIIAQQKAMDAETDKLVEAALGKADQAYKEQLMKELGLSYKLKESEAELKERERLVHLPKERVFTREAIKQVCIKYNLRFLSTEFYKGSLDGEIGAKLEEFKRLNDKKPVEKAKETKEELRPRIRYNAQDSQDYLSRMAMMSVAAAFGGWASGASYAHAPRYFIAAPKESFALQPKPVDPLLFADLGNDKFYLVHKWGSDLSVWRRVKVLSRNLWRPIIGGAIGGIDVFAWNEFFTNFQVKEAQPIAAAGIFVGIIGVVVLVAFLSISNDFYVKNNPLRNWDSPFRD